MMFVSGAEELHHDNIALATEIEHELHGDDMHVMNEDIRGIVRSQPKQHNIAHLMGRLDGSAGPHTDHVITAKHLLAACLQELQRPIATRLRDIHLLKQPHKTRVDFSFVELMNTCS